MEKEYIKMPIDQLIPYENNPRKNDEAVSYVEESINQVGYITPIVIDENNVILSGHTRLKAILAQKGEALSDTDTVDVLRVSGLSDEQKKKYRLLDNKTGEFATWDFEKLEEELADLDFGDFDFGLNIGGNIDFGDDDFVKDTEITKSKAKTITCPKCGHEFEL